MVGMEALLAQVGLLVTVAMVDCMAQVVAAVAVQQTGLIQVKEATVQVVYVQF